MLGLRPPQQTWQDLTMHRSGNSRLPPWQERLRLSLGGKVMVMGIGNSLKGDDGIGPEVVRRLEGASSLTVLCCEATPENFLGSVIKAHPDTILLVDAADLQAAAGTISLFLSAELPETSFSTHNMSPGGFLGFIRSQLPSVKCLLLLVQPGSCRLGEGLSPAVEQAAKAITSTLKELGRSTSS